MTKSANSVTVNTFTLPRYLPVWLSLILGVGLSVVAAGIVSKSEFARTQEHFERRADNLTLALQQNIDQYSQMTRALGRFYSVSDRVTRIKFTQFSQPFIDRHPGILGTGWAMRVMAAERNTYEQRMQVDGFANLSIQEQDRSGKLVTASQRPEYFPITYLEPSQELGEIVGYDLSSEWQYKIAIEKARDTGAMVAAGNISLLDRSSSSFLMFVPIYHQEMPDNTLQAHRQFFRGVVYTAFEIEQMVRPSLRHLNVKNLDFYLYQMPVDQLDSALNKTALDPNDRFLAYYNASKQELVTDPQLAKPIETITRMGDWRRLGWRASPSYCPYNPADVVCIRTVNVGNREWSLLIQPTPEFATISGHVGATLAIGFLLTSILVIYLSTSLKRAVQNEKLVTALREARHDLLTGLPNRRKFEEHLKQAFSNAQNFNQTHTLFYMDLDRFKIINDTCGHLAGDELLRQVANQLQTQVRKTDILARIGGDEFCLLAYQCTLEESLRIAEGILETIQAFQFVWEQKIFRIGISLGLATINSNTQSLNSLLRGADAACYAAKQNGRHRFQIYQENDGEQGIFGREIQWVRQINEGFADNLLRLYYQPIIPINDKGSSKYREILLRLKDGSGRVISPRELIVTAEHYNLMPTIDRWVIQKFFAYLSVTRGSEQPFYAINLSGASINDNQFQDFLLEQFRKYQISPQQICFEITETVAIAHLDRASQFIREMKAFGCRFALDDFGSGMSSFAYLRELPVDYLKIAGSFVRDIVEDAIAYGIVEAISRIGKVMNVKTVAEFVESEAILSQLRILGVDYAQGYGIAVPRPLA